MLSGNNIKKMKGHIKFEGELSQIEPKKMGNKETTKPKTEKSKIHCYNCQML